MINEEVKNITIKLNEILVFEFGDATLIFLVLIIYRFVCFDNVKLC